MKKKKKEDRKVEKRLSSFDQEFFDKKLKEAINYKKNSSK